eukprot:gene16744-biopygen6784
MWCRPSPKVMWVGIVDSGAWREHGAGVVRAIGHFRLGRHGRGAGLSCDPWPHRSSVTAMAGHWQRRPGHL